MVTFAYPWLLATLVLAPLMFYFLRYWKRQPGIRYPELESARLAVSGSAATRKRRLPRAPLLPALCFAVALGLLLLALARPRIGNEKLILRNQGIDMMMVLDLSGSMAAFDVPDNLRTRRELENAIQSGALKNRLDVAKEELSRFIQERPNDRIGLVGFAELGYNLAPPTLDHDWLLSSLTLLEPGVIGDGTGIAGALASGIRRLVDSPAPRRVLVLFTDGSNNVAHRLTPEQTAELAKEKDVVIYTVGIGSDNAYYPAQDLFGNRSLQPYQNEFDEALLKELASIAKGRYFRAADRQELANVMDEINTLEKTNFEQPRYVEYREFAGYLIAAASVLILLGVWLEATRCRTLP